MMEILASRIEEVKVVGWFIACGSRGDVELCQGFFCRKERVAAPVELVCEGLSWEMCAEAMGVDVECVNLEGYWMVDGDCPWRVDGEVPIGVVVGFHHMTFVFETVDQDVLRMVTAKDGRELVRRVRVGVGRKWRVLSQRDVVKETKIVFGG